MAGGWAPNSWFGWAPNTWEGLGAPGVVIALPLVPSGAAIFPPSILPGAVTITLPLVPSGASIFPPRIRSGLWQEPGYLTATAIRLVPDLVGSVTLVPETYDATVAA